VKIMFRKKREKLTKEMRKSRMRSFIICSLHQIRVLQGDNINSDEIIGVAYSKHIVEKYIQSDYKITSRKDIRKSIAEQFGRNNVKY
jgi:hypothetical protein